MVKNPQSMVRDSVPVLKWTPFKTDTTLKNQSPLPLGEGQGEGRSGWGALLTLTLSSHCRGRRGERKDSLVFQVLISILFISFFHLVSFSQENSPAVQTPGLFGMPVGYVVEGKRNVFILRAKSKLEAYKGVAVHWGDQIMTDSASTCLVEFPKQKVKIRLGPHSHYVIPAFTKNTQVHNLEGGLLWIYREASPHLWRINTKSAMLSFGGTDLFLKKSNEDIQIAVRAGDVLVKTMNFETRLKPFALFSYKDSQIPSIQGLSKDDFLDWEEPFEKF
ncbi:MAG: FecR domain-containing protein [Elusimicrobiota bacterium]